MLSKILTRQLLPIFLLLTFLLIAGCGEKNRNRENSSSSNNTSAAGMRNRPEQTPASYEGIIDVKSIDVNKDGKVYQCPMDYNVLSDNPGICPECNMDLDEVTIAKAEDNLVKSDFEIKK